MYTISLFYTLSYPKEQNVKELINNYCYSSSLLLPSSIFGVLPPKIKSRKLLGLPPSTVLLKFNSSLLLPLSIEIFLVLLLLLEEEELLLLPSSILIPVK